jgi:hypothetical protein
VDFAADNMTTKNKKPTHLTQALLETVDDMKRAGIMDEEAYGKITNRHHGIKDNPCYLKADVPARREKSSDTNS